VNKVKTTHKEAPKKTSSKTRKPSVFTKLSDKLKDVFSGNILIEGLEPSNLKFMLFITGLMVFYIGYGYNVDKTIKQKAKAEEDAAELHSELQSAKELYNQYSLQSRVAEELEVTGLKESIDPPITIFITPQKEQNK
jgi:hypothetical protein